MTDPADPVATAPAVPAVEFWFDFASTYSHLAAQRIEDAAAARGVAVTRRPFLLGPIFAAPGWNTSPLAIYADKGANMLRDMQRLCALQGLPPMVPPSPFPQHSVLAARVALILPAAQVPAFGRGVYMAEFAEGRDISRPETLAPILDGLGLDPRATMEAAQDPANKSALRAQTERAMALRIYGAPTFVTSDGELFWGADRLEHALDWETGAAPRP
ncbi:MAG: 2-hydroxychromene-2-carboxylate isomerase [Pseudomonadota bacterium]|nr:2-hydroxychromene-2-carboxylate isomerase [Pseudomonadota bacterium]